MIVMASLLIHSLHMDKMMEAVKLKRGHRLESRVRKILLLFSRVFTSIYKQFMSFFDFILIVVAILILLEEKIGFLYFYF